MIDTGSNGRSWLRAAGIVVAPGDGDRHACTQLRGRVDPFPNRPRLPSRKPYCADRFRCPWACCSMLPT